MGFHPVTGWGRYLEGRNVVVVSYSGREINAKLVYYGAGLSGKTTNLEAIYEAVPESSRGKMVSMKTQSDRTLFFDLLPLDLGEIMGYKTRFLLYTVPGQVFYNATRKLVLKGADAIVFVADSAIGKMEENKESLANLRANLNEYGVRLEDLPFVLQYNKRDLPNIHSVEEMNAELNPEGTIQVFEAVATQGGGVFETFRGISHLLMQKVTRELRRSSASSRSTRVAEDTDARPASPVMSKPHAAPAPSREPAFEPPPIEVDQTPPAFVPPKTAVPVNAPVARASETPRDESIELDYGRSIGLDATTRSTPAEPPVEKKPIGLKRIPEDEPLALDRITSTRPVARPKTEAHDEAPAKSSMPGYERTLTLGSQVAEARTDVARDGNGSTQEVVVPVRVQKGSRCEIVLRIVLETTDDTTP
jgi:signal recognition particle receptor subunit beta